MSQNWKQEGAEMPSSNPDVEQQFLEDLEKAKALSLETLALEKFSRSKGLDKGATDSAATSEPRSGSVELKPRPRPEPAGVGPRANASLAPPPSIRRQGSRSSNSSETTPTPEQPDLMSFSSPEKPTTILNTQSLYSSGTFPGTFQRAWCTFPGWNVPPQPPPPVGWNVPVQAGIFMPYPHTVIPALTLPTRPTTSQIFATASNGENVTTVVRRESAGQVLSASSNGDNVPSVTSIPRRDSTPNPYRSLTNQLRSMKVDGNLIDLSPDKNLSRRSVLEVFDPLLNEEEDEGIESAAEEQANLYDTYDPFDYMYSLSQCAARQDSVNAAVAKELSPAKPAVEEDSAIEEVESSEVFELDGRPRLPPRRRHISSRNSAEIRRRASLTLEKRSVHEYENVQLTRRKTAPRDFELEAFCTMVRELRASFHYDDPKTNRGLVKNQLLESFYPEDISVKVVVHAVGSESPATFTCDVGATVDHVVSQVLCSLDLPVTQTAYLLQVHGMNEYLLSPHSLHDFEYVHLCLKHDKDVQLHLVSADNIPRPLARTARDDNNDCDITLENLIPTPPGHPLSYDALTILLDTLDKECERLQTCAVSDAGVLQPRAVVQTVKAVCSLLGNVETLEVTVAVEGIQSICSLVSHGPVLSRALEVQGEEGPYSVVKLKSKSSGRDPDGKVARAIRELKGSVHDLVELYARAFRVNFQLVRLPEVHRGTRSLSSLSETLLLKLCAVHRLPLDWDFDEYLVAVQVYHGTRALCPPVLTCPSARGSGFHPRVEFKEWLEVPSIILCTLPRESRLVLLLYGRKLEVAEGKNEEAQMQQKELGWAAIQFFNYEGKFMEGNHLLSVWPIEADWRLGPAPAPGTHPEADLHLLISIQLPMWDDTIEFPPTVEQTPVRRREFSSLDDNTQQQLLDIVERDPFAKLPPEEREVLWEKRHYLYDEPAALPKILLAAHSWDFASLADLHALLHQWCPLDPVNALQLLMPCFPDLEVRRKAVGWLESLSEDELVDLLPQLVETLKHETWEPAPLSKFLLGHALGSPRLSHHLYWLLASLLPGQTPQNSPETLPMCSEQAALGEARYQRRLQLMLRALLAMVGEAARQRFMSQQLLDKSLNESAEHLKTTKESLRLTTLLRELETIHYTLEDMPTALPLGPGLEVNGLDVKSCAYFTSNTLPLRLSFNSAVEESCPIQAIYKVGDDLRQDQLTLQMIRIMDKLWLREGLDLKIVTFGCVPTGYRRGMVELVGNADTLRRIQTELGLTGSFKDRPIAEWLAKHNPSQLEYQRAVDNFTASCAGYSVATYVLGVCDRHNDNIMLTTSGHLFHIDFGKFLGDAQMFGNFKRDRTPFVLTSDMAYVINGGDRQSDRFHLFVDLCCQAFNIVRKHGNLFLNLFALMASSDIPGVSMDAVSYVQKALLPDLSGAEAAAHFARLIEGALRSWFTQVNFFLHNLAQLRFTGDHNNSTLLSFVPRTYTQQSDGRIYSVSVHGYQKRYDPEKYYVFIIRVEREGQPGCSYLFRSYREFCELHQKLCLSFPLAKMHSLPRGVTIGRSNVKQVAIKRRLEIERFLRSLFSLAEEIAHSALVYTFFHPLLRDQQESDVHLTKLRGPTVAEEAAYASGGQSGSISGQLKLSLHYRRGALAVLVQHARHLGCPSGQEPNAYVKVYLQPDPFKRTKRKTKIVRRNRHPSFMEMLEYRLPLEVIQGRRLEAAVWHHDRLQENVFLGAASVYLATLDLVTQDNSEWFPLVPRLQCDQSTMTR